MSLIEIKNLRKTYRMGDSEVRALDGVSLKIEAGEFVAIMGASGSGKSTLLQVLGLLDTPDSGSYKLLGREVAKLGEDELAAVRSRTLGFVFQQFNLLSRTSALENTSLPLLYAAPGAPKDDPAKLLREVGLGDRLGHKPNQLSGGQQQRVAIARALVNQPRVILADEPTGNLDSKSSVEILRLMDKLNRDGITILMVTHEPDVASHAHRIIRMKDGKVLSDRGRGRSRTQSAKGSVTPSASHAKFSLRQSKEYFHQALRALLANKARTFLSILGILIGVWAVITMLAIGTGASKAIEAQLASLGTNLLTLRPGSRNVGGVSQQTGSVSRLTLEDAREILSQVPDVRSVAPESTGRAQISFGNKNWNSQVVGTTPPYGAMKASLPEYGRLFTEQEVQGRSRVALVGTTVSRELFGESSPLGEWIKVNRVNFQVIGVLPSKGASSWRDENDVVLVPVTTAMYRLFGKQYVDQINIEAVAADKTGPVSQAAVELMMKTHRSRDEAAFQVRNLAEIQETMSSTTRTMTLLLSFIAGISLVVGGIGIMNIMLVSVTERTREIGLRKAVGARRKDILSQFLIESVSMSLIGGCWGTILGAGTAFLISMFAGWATVVTGGSILLACGFSVLIGIVFGLWPAIKASKLSPILALRYE